MNLFCPNPLGVRYLLSEQLHSIPGILIKKKKKNVWNIATGVKKHNSENFFKINAISYSDNNQSVTAIEKNWPYKIGSLDLTLIRIN